ncbi:MAG TPA: hypothetical protein VK501_01855 [Baekduia sp.]|uniref:hypothetical protein n=1 Tax=Baekduia sp. TaxID=2600305 RepID=UPI002C008EA0|nr:hypothetical protein [Baekduia sp.]HMJ32632.1 hypothetical protein [Baekduia sp.]
MSHLLRPPHPGLLALVAAVVLVAACGGGDATGTATSTSVRDGAEAPARLAICGPLAVTATGKVGTPEATEISGLVRSPDQLGVLWANNDSGDRARVFALRTDGSLIASLEVASAEAVDWEDIAAGPGGSLLLADIGDNRAARESVDVYRVAEPKLSSNPTSTAPATRLRLRYPDGAHDAETLLADPRTGELVIVTKQLDGRSGVYAARVPESGTPSSEQTLRRTGSLRLGLGGLATAGDVSGDGRTVAIRTYGALYAWARIPGASLAATLKRTPCTGRAGLSREGQGESLALSRDGRSYFTIPEGAGATVRRYSVRKQ